MRRDICGHEPKKQDGSPLQVARALGCRLLSARYLHQRVRMRKKTVSAEEFHRREEAGEELDDYIDWDNARRPGTAEPARNARVATGLSQVIFAERYGIPYQTFRDWEQGKRMADAAARNYLRVIARIPDIVAKALKDAA
ncbi:MAG: helix-turn-helix domain-containing protein [Longimicrobiales bacterium]